MTPELEDKLVRTFPLTFMHVHKRKGLQESLMGFGIEHDNGWYDIVWNMCSKLEPLIQKWIDENPAEEDHPAMLQMKEKYGTARYYLSYGTDEMYTITDEAERATETTCEQCGEPGTICGVSWLYTLCEKHRLERDIPKYKDDEDEENKT